MNSYIYLIRHGITEANQKRLYYGASDVPLADTGMEELAKLVEDGVYPEIKNGDFYTTGLRRTEQTLSLIFGRREHSVIEELREMNFGVFEMKSHEALKDDPDYVTWVSDKSRAMPCPEGESILGFYKRISRGFDSLVERHNRQSGAGSRPAVSVVVCHGGAIAAIMEKCFPREKENFYQWIPDPGHGYKLILQDSEINSYEGF